MAQKKQVEDFKKQPAPEEVEQPRPAIAEAATAVKEPAMTKKLMTTQETLGCLMYYCQNGNEPAYEKLTPEAQKEWTNLAIAAMVGIEKMNKKLVPLTNPQEERAAQMKIIDNLTAVIQAFVDQMKTTTPKLFPCRELAHRIIG